MGLFFGMASQTNYGKHKPLVVFVLAVNDFLTSGRCPFGQLPILELGDGKTICQSSAILRFLANDLGFSPNNSYDRARADMIVDSIKDLEDKFGALFSEKDEDRKVGKLFSKFCIDKFYLLVCKGKLDKLGKLKSSLSEDVLPKQMEYLNKLLQENNGGKGYFVGDKMTYADINVFCFFNGYIARGALEVPDLLNAFPLLVDLYNKVMNEPKVLGYLKKRKPNPDFYPY
ncbi:hypothetical protein QZH41_001006 [Actinostola sp. cb2023]|nr:hypothetical protein QZH41_001006 [Actinostola sp. cb2023]